MKNFWANIFRYPRFLISSLIGLILILMDPFRKWFKTRKLRLFLIVLLSSILISLFLIIKSMSAVEL